MQKLLFNNDECDVVLKEIENSIIGLKENTIKIYIHHEFNYGLFYKIAHNTKNRTHEKNDKEQIVNCTYKDKSLCLIFKKEISYENDGYHLLDFFTALLHGSQDEKIGQIIRGTNESESIPILKIFNKFLQDAPESQKWIILFLRTEKILVRRESFFDERLNDIEKELSQMDNHYLVTDNFFINEDVEKKYHNHFIALTNIIFQWKELFGVNWYYEYRKIFKKLNFDYDISYCVRNHKAYRIKLLKNLKKLNNKKIFLQRTDTLKNEDYEKFSYMVEDVYLNSISGNTDFSNRVHSKVHDTILGIDLFFNMLSLSKMCIVDESWSWSTHDFTSNYLSEKTIGPILVGIPFLSTNSYPLDIISKYLNVGRHPFYEDIKNTNGYPEKFSKFIENFMNQFDENYRLCENWINEVHDKFMNKIENENSLLDLFERNFEKEKNKKINSLI